MISVFDKVVHIEEEGENADYQYISHYVFKGLSIQGHKNWGLSDEETSVIVDKWKTTIQSDVLSSNVP